MQLLGNIKIEAFDVALLAEGVDRNPFCSSSARYVRVALLAEGVDRNIALGTNDRNQS